MGVLFIAKIAKLTSELESHRTFYCPLSLGLPVWTGAGWDQPEAGVFRLSLPGLERHSADVEPLQLQQYPLLFLSTVGNMDSWHHDHQLGGNDVGARLQQELHVVSARLDLKRNLYLFVVLVRVVVGGGDVVGSGDCGGGGDGGGGGGVTRSVEERSFQQLKSTWT